MLGAATIFIRSPNSCKEIMTMFDPPTGPAVQYFLLPLRKASPVNVLQIMLERPIHFRQISTTVPLTAAC